MLLWSWDRAQGDGGGNLVGTKKGSYEITAAGREYVASESFRDNIRKIFADLKAQNKSEEEIMTAAFVFTATRLITDGAKEMDVDISRMRAFIATHQDGIQTALGSVLNTMPEKQKNRRR